MQSRGPIGYRELSPSRLASYLGGLPEITARLGGREPLWRIAEVEGGRMNRVFIVEGPGGQICVKQALSYVRALGETWPLPPERIIFEEAALTLYARFAPGLAPRIIHFDSEMFLLVMERLHPHTTLRQGIIDGRTYPLFAEQIVRFLAQTLFMTSDLAMPAPEKKERIAFFCGNADLCKLSEDQIFTAPYVAGNGSREGAPGLHALVTAIRADAELKRAIAALKLKFMTEPQALIHGDLRTGSIMTTPTDTKVIDPEFAFFGPIGFDLGKLLGSLLMAYFSQAGYATERRPRDDCERWLIEAIEKIWRDFRDRFLGLWRSAHTGDAYPQTLFEGPDGRSALADAQADYLRGIFQDTLRFAGASMIAQTVGVFDNRLLTGIPDPGLRATCERRVLLLARELAKDAHYVDDIAEVTTAARQLRSGDGAAT